MLHTKFHCNQLKPTISVEEEFTTVVAATIVHVTKIIQKNFCSPDSWKLHIKSNFRLAEDKIGKVASPESVPTYIKFP